MKRFLPICIVISALLALTGCSAAEGDAAPDSGADSFSSAPVSTETDGTTSDYDAMFTDLNEAAFTGWASDAIEDGENYFRTERIDVVDENGYDHQAIVYVCSGSDGYTQTFRTYLEQLREVYGEHTGAIVGYRNAAVTGDRTYRTMDVAFLGIQEVTFTDRNGAQHTGVVVAVDGPEEFKDLESDLFTEFIDYYTGGNED